MTPAHLIAVTDWVIWVAEGTGMPTGADPDAVIKTRTSMLGDKYPDTRMFTQASAAFVAIECGLMSLPSVGILGKFLEKWWAKNKPAQIAIAPPGDGELNASGLSGVDRALVRSWLRDCAEDVRTEREMTVALSVIRRYGPAGYRWLLDARLDASMRAADIAVRQGWLGSEHRWAPPSEDEIAAVAQSVQALRALALPGGVSPPEARVPPAEHPPVPSPPSGPAKPPGALDSAQIHTLRMTNALLRPIAERLAEDTPAAAEDWTPSYLRVAR